MSEEPVSPGGLSQQEFLRIIAAYDQATSDLQKTHASLKEQVARLTGELSRKNEALVSSLEEVSALKNYLANILESITDGVIAIDPAGRVMAFNQSAAEVVLSGANDQTGRPVQEVLPQPAAELGRILLRALHDQAELTNIEVQLEGPLRRVLSVSASLIRNEKSEVLGAVETFRDLTAIKQLEAKAARQDRLAALGEMAAGVAHEIRNPLGGIELYASTLKRRFEAGSKEAEMADKICSASTALNRIVSDMLTFTRGREPVCKPSVLERVCATALDMAARALEDKHIHVELQHHLQKQRIPVDADLIAQAFLNVILNAIQFTPENGTLIIRSNLVGEPGQQAAIVEFEDGGPGITDEVAAKLFNPFFTTRREGTGLGLAIVHKIVQDHGAQISVENRPPPRRLLLFPLPGRRAGHINTPAPPPSVP